MLPWSDTNRYSQPTSSELTIFPRASNYSDLSAFLQDTILAVEHEREYRANGYQACLRLEEPSYQPINFRFDVI